MARVFRMTPGRRNALRKATAASARKRRGGTKSKDTFAPYFRQGIRWLANKPTGGGAGALSNFVENKPSRPGKWAKLYRDQSGKRKRRK